MSRAGQVSQTVSGNESPAQQVARRLIDSSRAGPVGDDTDAQATLNACDRLFGELSRWVGPDGCRALFTRALAEARTEFPTAQEIQLRARSELDSDGAVFIMTHTDAATAAALESMLIHVVELLGRLIGTDMAMKLIERGLAVPGGATAASGGKREES